MKLIETADGTVRVVELDPTKAHVLFIDEASPIGPIRLVDGAIIWTRHGGEYTIVEGERTTIEATEVMILSRDEVEMRRRAKAETDSAG